MERRASKLAGKRVLVVEDEYLIASELERQLKGIGVHVLGPVNSVASALQMIAEGARLDAAVLDINLDLKFDVYPVAEALRARAVPFVFATGYDRATVRRDFADVPHFAKPFDVAGLEQALF